MPGDPRSTISATRFWADRTGRLPTMSHVRSFGAGVRGSSEGWLTIPLPEAVTKLWLQSSVPLGVFGLTTTLKVTVATLAWLLDASAGIEPGVVLTGELISIPFTSGDVPATSAAAVPFSVVLPATYVVFAGTASRNTTFTAPALLMFFTVIV